MLNAFSCLRAAMLLSILLFTSSCVPVVLGAATTTGMVVAQERTVGDAVDDATIWTKIKSDMLQKDVDKLFALVDVKVTEGRVMLTGTVPSQEARMQAVKIAWSQRGVKEVINELKIATPTGKLAIKDYSLDTWITTQIKSKLLLDQEIRSVNYSVETIEGVVYLMGIAQSQEELNKVTNIAGTVKYVKKVISHVRLKTSSKRETNVVY